MRYIIIPITAEDELRAREITFNGVLDGKIAKGEYADVNPGRLSEDDLETLEHLTAGIV